MESQTKQPRAIPYRPRKSMLNWIDFLVILATVLVFAAVVAVNNPHARAQTRGSTLLTAAELPEQVSQLPIDAGLVKARLGLANAGL